MSLAGTKAYAQLPGEAPGTARVLDLGYGGVAIETSASEALAANFNAILHVPILPPVRVSLKKLTTSAAPAGNTASVAPSSHKPSPFAIPPACFIIAKPESSRTDRYRSLPGLSREYAQDDEVRPQAEDEDASERAAETVDAVG